jgi:uncharacterized SAM-binding protein YcdF (DUF218 family)
MLFWLKKFITFWLMPLPASLVLAGMGLWLIRSGRRPRLGRVLIATAAIIILVLSNSVVSKVLMRSLQDRHPPVAEFAPGQPIPAGVARVRYVVVLGGGNGYSPGVSANNLLSSSAISRLTEGVRIMRAVPEARLVVTGGGPKGRITHAEVLARAAIQLGIDPSRIIRSEDGRDTEDEANRVARIAGGAPVAVATSAWHLPRAMALFRGAGVDALACPSDYHAHANDPFSVEDLLCDPSSLGRSSLALRERLGLVWITLRGKG